MFLLEFSFINIPGAEKTRGRQQDETPTICSSKFQEVLAKLPRQKWGEMGEGGESGEMGQEEGKGWKSHLAWLLNTFMYITFCRLLFCDSLLMIYRNHQEDAPSFDLA